MGNGKMVVWEGRMIIDCELHTKKVHSSSWDSDRINICTSIRHAFSENDI